MTSRGRPQTPREWGRYWGKICFPQWDPENETGFTDKEIEQALRRPYKKTVQRDNAWQPAP